MAVKQALQVILSERVVRALADQGGEGRERPWVAAFELLEGPEIGEGGRGEAFALRQRLEGAGRLAAAPQHEVPDRPAEEPLRALCSYAADADARAQLFVDRLEPGSGVDRVAVGGVVEQPAAAKIAHDRRTGVDADAGCTERHAVLSPFLAVFLGTGVERERAGHGAGRGVRLVGRGPEQDMD